VTLQSPEFPPEGIELVPIGPVAPSLLQELTPGLRQRFGIPVSLGAPLPLDPAWFDPDRNQYRAGPVLDLLVDRQCNGARTLGIIDADIFAPELNFIFGQALVGGCCALIGLARLRPEFHHEEPDPELFARRTLIEAVHELGHTAGLDHCPNQHCVMNFSRTIEDSDRKGPDFCPQCQTRLDT
jgi:archaemetzincin